MKNLDEIINYVIHTPYNSNPNVMRGLLESDESTPEKEEVNFNATINAVINWEEPLGTTPIISMEEEEKIKLLTFLENNNESYNLFNVKLNIKTSDEKIETFYGLKCVPDANSLEGATIQLIFINPKSSYTHCIKYTTYGDKFVYTFYYFDTPTY